MSNIKNYNPNEAEALDSREVAEMVGKQHKHLLRDINGYIEEMEKTGGPNFGLSSNQPKINPSDFFIPSTYTSEQGKELPCFLVTKKGCEFIANKLTGEKGTKFTALYVTRFNTMEEREKAAIGDSRSRRGPEIPSLSAINTAMKLIAQTMDEAHVDPSFKLLAMRNTYGRYGIDVPTDILPDLEKTYDLTTMARMLGVVSAKSGNPHNKAIGAIIQRVGVMDKEVKQLPYTNNGHSGFTEQYTDAVVERVQRWLETNGWPTTIASLDGTNFKVRYLER